MELPPSLVVEVVSLAVVAGAGYAGIRANGKATARELTGLREANQKEFSELKHELEEVGQRQRETAETVTKIQVTLTGMNGDNGVLSRVKHLEAGHEQILQEIARSRRRRREE